MKIINIKTVMIAVVSFLLSCIVFLGTIYYSEINKYNFTGQSTKGKLSLKDLKGQNIVVYFGYTYCPDVCPLTLENLLKAVEGLKDKNILPKDILLLYVTLDPARDTVEALDEYAGWFYPNSIGIRFEEKELEKTAKNYNIKYQIFPIDNSSADYSVAHSSALFFFNKNGKMVEKVTNLTVENITGALVKVMDIK